MPPDSPVTYSEYVPQTQVTGTITTWGHVFMKPAMKSWEAGFKKFHPDVQFVDNLVSSAAATGALFTHTADLGFVGPCEFARWKSRATTKPGDEAQAFQEFR